MVIFLSFTVCLELSLGDIFSLRAREDGLQKVVLTKGLAAKIKEVASSSTSLPFSAWHKWGRRSVAPQDARMTVTLNGFMTVFHSDLSQRAHVYNLLHMLIFSPYMTFLQSLFTHDKK